MSFGTAWPGEGSDDYWQQWRTRGQANEWSDPWSSYGQAFQGPLVYQPYHTGQMEYAPSYGVGGYQPASLYGMQVIQQQVESYLQKYHPEYYQAPTAAGPPQYAEGMASPSDTAWGAVNKSDALIRQYITQVAGETGVLVPGNVVKAIAQIESQGNPNAYNQGSGATGLLQVTDQGSMANVAGGYDYNRARSDPNYAIYAGILELANRYREAQSLKAGYDWTNVANAYFSGHFEPDGSTDGISTDHDYSKRFTEYLNQLNGLSQASPAQGGSYNPSKGTKQWNAIWGGTEAPTTQEFGPTPFAQAHAEDYYKFVTQYGLPYGSHPGVDIGVSDGTRLFSPIAGTVVNAGGTGYYQDDRYGNQPGTGELRIQLANGDQLILGHMSSIGVRAGDRISAGQEVGRSGYANGDHVHVEYRHYDPAFTDNPEHMQIVDPRQALGGSFTGTYSTQPGYGGNAPTPTTNTWLDFMQAAATGQPLYAAGQGILPTGSFHDYLLQQMSTTLGISGIPLMALGAEAPLPPDYAGGKVTQAGQAAGWDWSLLDQQNGNIQAAVDRVQQQLGIQVPANLVKGILAREGSFGRDFYTVPLRGDQLLAYNGVFKGTLDSYPALRGNWNKMTSDRAYAVYATAYILGSLYKQQGGQYGWEGTASTYFGGSPTGGFTDELGNTTSDYLYGQNGVVTHWHNLDMLAQQGK